MMPRPVPLFRTLFLLAAVSFGSCGRAASPAPRSSGRDVVLGSGTEAHAVAFPLPDLDVRTLDGSLLDPEALADRSVLVNFWATWCGPCLREIPDLVRLRGELGPDRLAIVSIALNDPDSTRIVEFAHEQEMNWPVVIDPDGALSDAFGGVYVMPTTFLATPRGEVVRRFSGIVQLDSLRAVLAQSAFSPDRE